MSQSKVDQNIDRKNNRRKLLKKERRKQIITSICFTVVFVAVVGFVGYSGYKNYQKKQDARVVSTKVNLTPISDYMNQIAGQVTTDQNAAVNQSQSQTADQAGQTGQAAN